MIISLVMGDSPVGRLLLSHAYELKGQQVAFLIAAVEVFGLHLQNCR